MAAVIADNLVSQVRSLLDEENADTIDSVEDILPALNRAQTYAAGILARHYEEPLLTLAPLTVEAGRREYPLPENAFQQRLEKVEITIPKSSTEAGTAGDQYEVMRISYRDISDYETNIQVNIPRYYAMKGERFRLVPTPTGTYDGRIWYLRQPEPLVLQQGRIAIVNEVDDYVRVEGIGSDLSTETDDLASYVNIVDGTTGLIKVTRQIKRIEGDKIEFKSTPSRTTVLGRTVDTDLVDIPDPDTFGEPGTTVVVEPDDYICGVSGSCVLYFRDPLSNFVIQHSVAQLQRKLGGNSDMEERVLKKYETMVERQWAGREQSLRIQKRSKNWDRSRRRWPFTQG